LFGVDREHQVVLPSRHCVSSLSGGTPPGRRRPGEATNLEVLALVGSSPGEPAPALGGPGSQPEDAGPVAGRRDFSINERLDMVPALADSRRIVEPLPGGLTNTNLKVSTSTGTYVARLSRPSSNLLAIDRQAEYLNSVAAASAGVGPAVIDWIPAAGVLLIEWLPGRTLEPTDLQDDRILTGVATSCRQLHSGPRFVSEFNMFDIQAGYLETARGRRFRLPAGYVEFTSQWQQVRTVLAMDPPPSAPCHNDLLAANFIEDNGRLWLIDYEYSGNNDPCFELGNIWSESNLSPAHLELLVDSYFGDHRPAMIARARLQGLVSQYGWTLWGVIQNAVSELNFDFWTWAMEKYDRAVATFGSPAFTDLLTAAAARQASPRSDPQL
jgi:thiamine kinase-like enzyme